jgi:hypothetical protein
MSKEITELTSAVRNHYDRLFQDGFLVSVHVSKWGMSTQLDKDDINYDPTKALPSIFRLGKKMLINPERLNEFMRIESRARRFLAANSYDFPVADAYFVPKKKVAVVLDTLNNFKTEYLTLRDTFIKNYDVYKTEIANNYPDIAEDLKQAYPAADKIASKFGFSVSLFEIQMPQSMGEVDIQSLITRDKAEAEVKKELEDRLKGHYDESLKKIEKFTQDAATKVRSEIVSMCEGVSEKIKKREVISRRNIQSVLDSLADFKALNFLDDAVVTKALNDLETVVSAKLDYKTDATALAALDAGLTTVLDDVRNINDLNEVSEKYFRAIKL